VLFGSPSRPTYEPERARALLRRLLTTFPDSKHAEDAQDRLALLDEVVRARSADARVRELEARIAELTAQQGRLRAQLDSAQAQSDASRRSAARLESDARDRDEQLRALRLELKQLKEIDLKPRSAGRRPPTE
jgi:chromosome segregation ATPase